MIFIQTLILFGILLCVARSSYYLRKLKVKWHDQVKFENNKIEKLDDLI